MDIHSFHIDVENTVMEIIEDVLLCAKGEVSLLSAPDNLEGWDSLAHLNIVLALEEKFKLKFTADDVEKLKSVGHIIGLIKAKLGD